MYAYLYLLILAAAVVAAATTANISNQKGGRDQN